MSKDGEICVAWDTYKKDDYDVYFVTATADGVFSAPAPAAASLAYEARPSVAYDKESRLWIAWESAGEKWGKDFGALDKGYGTPPYKQGRNVEVKCFINRVPHQTAQGPLTNALNPIKKFNNRPRLGVDGDGRVWLAFRHRGARTRGGAGTAWFN